MIKYLISLFRPKTIDEYPKIDFKQLNLFKKKPKPHNPEDYSPSKWLDLEWVRKVSGDDK